MPAAVESAVYANLPAWHGLGTVLDTEGDQGISVEVALKKSKLDWEVEKVPAFCLSREYADIGNLKQLKEAIKSGRPITLKDLEFIEDRSGVQRKTDGRVFGTVGGTWEPVQNAQGFQIIEDVIEQAGGDQVWIESAGSLEGGRRVWVLAHVDAGLQVAGEKYASYILFTNGHNGRCSVTAAMLDMRVVCANTLDWGLMEAQQSGRIVRVRHTVKAAERIKEAHAILGMRNERLEALAKQGEWLVEQPMDDGEFNNFLETLMPIEEKHEGKPAETMIQGRRDQVSHIYFEAPNLESIRGTVWGGLHAVTEYADHAREFKTAETQLKAQFGITNQPLKQQAYDLAMAFAMTG